MPRKGPAPKRPVVADPVYGAPIVTQLVNKILLDGKKDLAQRIVYGALEGVATKSSQDPVIVLKKALDNVRPTLEVRSNINSYKRYADGSFAPTAIAWGDLVREGQLRPARPDAACGRYREARHLGFQCDPCQKWP